MRVIGYVRVSTEEQASEGVSLAAQEHKVRGYCALYDHELVEVIADAGVSAKTLDRPGMRRALALLESGEADGMVIANLDRMTRSVRDLNHLIDHHFGEGRPSALMSVSDSLDTRTASGILVINILGSVAQWQRQYIVERTRAVLSHKRGKGERTGGVQYGLDLDHAGRRNQADRPIELRVNAREFEVLKLIEGWDGAGWTLRQIAAELNERGISTKRGKGPWGHSSVGAILANLPFLRSTYGDGTTASASENGAG